MKKTEHVLGGVESVYARKDKAAMSLVVSNNLSVIFGLLCFFLVVIQGLSEGFYKKVSYVRDTCFTDT